MTDGSSTHAAIVEAAIHRDGEYLLAERSADEDHAAGQLRADTIAVHPGLASRRK